MAGSYPSQLNPGAFIASTNVWNASEIQNNDSLPPEIKSLFVSLYQNLNNMAILINLKDTGYYTLQEFLPSQSFFPNPALDSTTAQSPTIRQTFRTVINFGALPNAGSKSVAHHIQISTTLPTNYSFTRIYGASSNPDQTSFIPLPYASPTSNKNISIEITNTNVVITTGIDYSAYTTTYIICEYIKS